MYHESKMGFCKEASNSITDKCMFIHYLAKERMPWLNVP